MVVIRVIHKYSSFPSFGGTYGDYTLLPIEVRCDHMTCFGLGIVSRSDGCQSQGVLQEAVHASLVSSSSCNQQLQEVTESNRSNRK